MTNLGWTDNCDGTGNVTGTDVSDGLSCPETITRTWTYTDACGNTATVSQTIIVDDTTPPTGSNPGPISVTGVGAIPPADPLIVNDEADNCTVSPVVVWVSDVSDNGNCPEIITRTYSITDDCGNQTLVTQIISVGDAIPPTASNPAPISVQCSGDVPAPDPLVVTDEADNGAPPVVTFESDVSDGLTCPETITRTYRVTDDCGNFIFVTQTITIHDTQVPVFAAPPANVTVECIGDVPAMTNLGWTDNCDGAGNVTGSDVSDGLSCPETITRTWTYTDACGNTATETQTITVQDTQAPVFAAAPANATYECIGDVPAMAGLGWTDNCDGAGTDAGTEVSDGLTCPETITRTWTYTDACGNTATETQTITVIDTQAPVFAAAPANVTVECIGDVPAMANLGWTDNCDGAGNVTGADVSDGLTCPETITRTWTYTDACGNTATETQTITVIDTQAPVFAAPPANVTVECAGDVPAMTNLGWTDNCDGAGNVTGADVSDGLSCPETITRTWTYTDACGNNATVSQTIIVDDTTPPTASNPTGISITQGTPIPPADPLVVTDEADNCTVNPVVAWVNDVSDNGNCPEIITRTFSITDECGNQSTVVQLITIGDPISPTASNPAPVNVQCAGDVPAPDPLVVTDEADNGAQPVVTFESDVSDGLSCPETITRTYRVTDDCGNFIFVTQTITIHDTQVPVLAAAPANVTVECIGDVPAMTNLGWTDNCDGAGNVTGADVSDGLSCPETITRTWTYTDACGNTATETQTITVIDTQAPVFAA
ncbi:gliding motility-associated C-terminal domain-containing protein, partial [Crocinitomicaceae bacterium]|nr:gliding motility-associated C-terminal domain-containing protein [Crocinitomicaceae bacterium]